MNLHPKKRVIALFTALVILCTIQIACVPATVVESGVSNESSSEAKESVKKSEPATTETTDETETVVEAQTVAPATAPSETEKPNEVEKTDKKDVTAAPVTTETTELSKSSYAEDDLFYLAAAVCREAGGSSEEIQMLVANVVINRVNSPLFPNTIYSVLTQRKQYGTMWKYGVSFPEWATQSVKDQCYSVARRILNGERVCPANVVFQAEFKQGTGVYKEFDGFYFCYC